MLHDEVSDMIYCDKTFLTYEQQKNYPGAIAYLEGLYYETKSLDKPLALFADSWYYFDMPDISPSANKEMYDKWKQYTDIIVSEKLDDLASYVVGYVLSLHGFYFGPAYEEEGKALMLKCAEKSTDIRVRKLAERFIVREQRRTVKKYPPCDMSDCFELFPSESLVDGYFRRIIMMYGRQH